MRYNNYHKHDHRANPWVPDSIAKEIDYCKRAVELGHTMVFSTNHGMQGDIFTWKEAAEEYNLKLAYGVETYYVNDFADKERGKHLVIIAKNRAGAEQLNDVITTSYEKGFYYNPRIDRNLLLSLEPENYILTTACVAGIWDDTELILAIRKRFGSNFFLEMQDHNADFQRNVNKTLLDLSANTGIKIIHANDSHYIYPEDDEYRNIFLKGKKRLYENEDEMVLDYPDSDVIFERYAAQGILTKSQVQEALENTLVFDDCEELNLINDDVKLPSVSDRPEEELKEIINASWKKERENIPRSEWGKYLEAMRYEMDVVEKTHMQNYFLIDYKVVQAGQQKYGGTLTKTGRGSAPSFYITKMLGLTDIDRVASPITLFPSRFMSTERILGARSLPDIDLNTADKEPFVKATEDLLGAENCAWMLAWKPLQEASAFRLYCRAQGITDYDNVSKNLDDYVDDETWHPIIEESKRYVGVIESVSESPCSMLLYDQPVRRKLGLVRTSSGKMCCLLDGYNCDKYKYLKNDYLTTTVWAIIADTCDMVGIPIPTIHDLDKLLDPQTFDIYKNGLTCTINQADSDYAMPLAKIYQPQSVSEMSAFVAIIRPGCASLLDDFINREPYSTGVQELDSLLDDSDHRLIYQESIMKYLIWLGVKESESYDIIKKIAKKKFKEEELTELKKQLLSGWMNRVGTEDGFEDTWTVVEQAAHYSFNACVSGDTKVLGVDKTIEEIFISDLHKRKAIYTWSLFYDKELFKNRMIEIQYSGKANIYRVQTQSGAYVDCTMNHKFPTPTGQKKLCQLYIGDELYSAVRGRGTPDKIQSITFLRYDHVYDVQMGSAAHNFTTESGLITCNSHSLSYAYDSLYGAYLKSHYPLEYYTVVFNYYDGDLARTAKLKAELPYFDIMFESIKFGRSLSEYTFSRSERTIYKGIKSIKYMNDVVANEIYALRNYFYDSFIDLLYDLKERTSINSRQIQVLIELDFFSALGDANYLLKVYDLFLKYGKRVQFRKDEVDLPEETVLRYAGKESEKMYSQIDTRGLLNELASRINYHPRKIKERVAAQMQYQGYIDYVNPACKLMLFVMEVDTRYTPKITAYSLRRGKVDTYKIDRKTFYSKKGDMVQSGDIILATRLDKKQKVRKNDEGEWEEIPDTLEYWLPNYRKVNI